MLINLEEHSEHYIYRLMSQTIIPRPIAWIVTQDDDIINIAPFSYFAPLASVPPSVVVSIGHKDDGVPKDTLVNIRREKKCTICMIREDDVEKMHFSSKSLPKDDSEAEEFGIKTKEVLEDFPPMVKGVPCAYFCTFNQEVDLGEDSTTIPIILNVERVYLEDEIVTKEDKHVIKFDPIGRIGKSYTKMGETIIPPVIPE